MKRSASLVPDAVAPEANRTLYNERVNQTCSQGCGTERVDGTCNTLDFWGYREVNALELQRAYNDSGAVHNGRSGAPSFVWYLGGCVTPVDLDGASAWNGQGTLRRSPGRLHCSAQSRMRDSERGKAALSPGRRCGRRRLG